jgi:hypothetical protein
MGYGLGARGSIPAGEMFSLLYNLQIDSGVHPASYPKGTRDSFPRVKATGREADHSPPFSVEIKDGGATLSLSEISLWRST